MRTRARRIAVALLAALAACGPAGMVGRGNPTLLTAEEIQESGATTVYDAVQRLRPSWLIHRYQGGSRGQPTIFVASQRYGGTESLRTIETANVREVRYYDAVSAPARFGRNVPFGVIQVILDIGG